jgi:hypothetical protein
MALRLPCGRVEDVRVQRIERDVVRAGALAAEQHVLPVAAAVLRPEDAALRVRPPRVTERGDEDDVGAPRMHDDAADVARIGESDVGPRLAAIGRSIDAIAVRHVVADARLAGAGVDDVGVGRRNRDRADAAV